MLVVGDREADTNTVSVRERAGGDKGSSSVADFVAKALDEIAAKGKQPAAGPELSAASGL